MIRFIKCMKRRADITPEQFREYWADPRFTALLDRVANMTGGRRVYRDRQTRYSDYNRVTGSLRQPGSAMKPLVYLAAFELGLDLDATVPDEPISVPGDSPADGVKWIANYDDTFKGPIPARQALAESRNAVAVWIAASVGMRKVIRTCQDLGFRTPLSPYISTALGASEVRLLELAVAYRAMASGVRAEPHVIARVTDSTGSLLYEAPGATGEIPPDGSCRNLQC